MDIEKIFMNTFSLNINNVKTTSSFSSRTKYTTRRDCIRSNLILESIDIRHCEVKTNHKEIIIRLKRD